MGLDLFLLKQAHILFVMRYSHAYTGPAYFACQCMIIFMLEGSNTVPQPQLPFLYPLRTLTWHNTHTQVAHTLTVCSTGNLLCWLPSAKVLSDHRMLKRIHVCSYFLCMLVGSCKGLLRQLHTHTHTHTHCIISLADDQFSDIMTKNKATAPHSALQKGSARPTIQRDIT